ISHLAAEDLHHGGQRTKLEHYRDHFHVAVHDCTLVEDVLTTREIDIVFGDGWLLSVRQPSDNPSDPAPFALDKVIHRFEMERSEEEAWDEGFLLWSFLDVIVHSQDVYDHVLRVTDWIETQRDLLTGLLEADLAVVSNRLNQVMKRMTSWGAILLGSTLIAGIYGMNFKNMPELGWAFGYPLALGTMLALTIFLYTWFKRRDWL